MRHKLCHDGWCCWVLMRLDKAQAFHYQTRGLARRFQKFARSQGKNFTRVLRADKSCPFEVETYVHHYRIIDWLRRAWRRVVQFMKG